MTELLLPPGLAKPSTSYQPTTFLERGVSVSFTTPALAGARVRPGERDPLELIVANPSGGRGVYILPWHGVAQLCTPTLHDRALNAKVQLLSVVSPSAIRRLTVETAAEGLAGEEAAAAARRVMAAESNVRTLANFELLMLLVRQMDRSFDFQSALRAGELEVRAKRTLATLAPRFGRSPEQVAQLLEELAQVFGPVGVGRAAETARLPSGIARLEDMRSSIHAWLQGPPPRSNPDAELVGVTADLTISLARATLADAQSLLDDVPGLLRRWIREPQGVGSLAARTDWLLDGWERIVFLWHDGAGQRDTSLSELADLVPATPREVSDWVSHDVQLGTAGALRHRRKVTQHEDWRTGITLQDTVARNERLCAASVNAMVAG